MIGFFEDLLALQPDRVRTFVEPFAGGASVSLHLAAAGLVDRVVLGEADPLVHAFWVTACFDTDWLVDAVAAVPVTLQQWDAFKASAGRSVRDRALAALFLNRTSFSGILHGRSGPIGGRAQQSAYTLGCRFTKPTIIDRIRSVGALASSGVIADVFLGHYETTIASTLAVHGAGPDTLVYLDPPYWAKAETLYASSFVEADHRALAAALGEARYRWLLSYDAHPEVVALYASRASGWRYLVDLRYSAHSSRRASEELVVTNVSDVPTWLMRTPADVTIAP